MIDRNTVLIGDGLHNGLDAKPEWAYDHDVITDFDLVHEPPKGKTRLAPYSLRKRAQRDDPSSVCS
jgi:hypothetical protein